MRLYPWSHSSDVSTSKAGQEIIANPAAIARPGYRRHENHLAGFVGLLVLGIRYEAQSLLDSGTSPDLRVAALEVEVLSQGIIFGIVAITLEA